MARIAAASRHQNPETLPYLGLVAALQVTVFVLAGAPCNLQQSRSEMGAADTAGMASCSCVRCATFAGPVLCAWGTTKGNGRSIDVQTHAHTHSAHRTVFMGASSSSQAAEAAAAAAPDPLAAAPTSTLAEKEDYLTLQYMLESSRCAQEDAGFCFPIHFPNRCFLCFCDAVSCARC